MNTIFKDEARIKLFSQIQADLTDLQPNSTNEEIDSLINKIPKLYLEQKEDLMVIFSLFAYYGRNNIKYLQKNTFKLIEKILKPIKTHFQNESSLIWNIFGSIHYFHYWMYEEGLISIEEIIQQSKIDTTFTVIEYFLPEIFEREPEIFEKEFKNKLKIPFSIERMNEFKELRNKHVKWIRESCDFNDPFYREIEKNPLRLSIKTDDVDTFQTILSNSNISIDSMIQESVLESCYLHPHEISLINFALDFNAEKIFKYLIMNGAKTDNQSIYNSICSRNYEMIHIIESKDISNFKKFSLLHSIMCCNHELILYSIENYNFEFFEKENFDEKDNETLLNFIFYFSYSVNFRFFESILLPFLRKNEQLVNKNINEIIMNSMKDFSCFFIKEFLKYPGVDINYFSIKENNHYDSLLIHAIRFRNDQIVEFLLNDPKIIIDNYVSDKYLPFHFACAKHSDLKVIDMFCNHPKFNIYELDPMRLVTAFTYGAVRGNFYVIDYILKKFPDYKENIDFVKKIIYQTMSSNNLLTSKLLFKFFAKLMEKNVTDKELIEDLVLSDFPQKFIDDLIKIQNEFS